MQGTKSEMLSMITKLMNNQQYSSAKNLAEWCKWKWPAEFDLNNADKCYNVLMMAEAAKNLGDFQLAFRLAGELSKRHPAYCRDIVNQMIVRCGKELNPKPRGPVINCDNMRLRPIMKRMGVIFHSIRKPVSVFVAGSRQEYEKFHWTTFPGKEIHPYDSFLACSFYYSATCEWLVFKSEIIRPSISDDAVIGACAHEMAHLDLRTKGIAHGFFSTGMTDKLDVNLNERLTDMYVLSKGLAYSLYRSRMEHGNSSAGIILSQEDIERYITSLVVKK